MSKTEKVERKDTGIHIVVLMVQSQAVQILKEIELNHVNKYRKKIGGETNTLLTVNVENDSAN